LYTYNIGITSAESPRPRAEHRTAPPRDLRDRYHEHGCRGDQCVTKVQQWIRVVGLLGRPVIGQHAAGQYDGRSALGATRRRRPGHGVRVHRAALWSAKI